MRTVLLIKLPHTYQLQQPVHTSGSLRGKYKDIAYCLHPPSCWKYKGGSQVCSTGNDPGVDDSSPFSTLSPVCDEHGAAATAPAAAGAVPLPAVGAAAVGAAM